MQELLQALTLLGSGLSALVVAIVKPLLPWIPLAAWVLFWMLAVNWVKFRAVLAKGGWIGLVLLGAVIVLVWGTLAPPVAGTTLLFGLRLSNYVEKTVYVSALASIMFLAGSVQLSGGCGCCLDLSEPPTGDEHDDHGHDSHGHDLHAAPAEHGAAAVALAHH